MRYVILFYIVSLNACFLELWIRLDKGFQRKKYILFGDYNLWPLNL